MIFHPEALEEFNDAAVYYEEQSPGLGFRFVEAIGSGFRQIQHSPITWRCIRGDIRRFLVKTFPYGIAYATIENEIFVLAIMHLKREPELLARAAARFALSRVVARRLFGQLVG